MSRKSTYVRIIKEEVIRGLEAINKTQRSMAEELGISFEHLNRCLSKGQISKTWLISIAQYLDISVGTLTGSDDLGLTYFGEQRGKLIENRDEVLIQVFLLCGFSREQFEVLENWEVSNLVSDIDFVIARAIHSSVNAPKEDKLPF